MDDDGLSENGIVCMILQRISCTALEQAQGKGDFIVHQPDGVSAVLLIQGEIEPEHIVKGNGRVVTLISAPAVSLKMPVGISVPVSLMNAASSAFAKFFSSRSDRQPSMSKDASWTKSSSSFTNSDSLWESTG